MSNKWSGKDLKYTQKDARQSHVSLYFYALGEEHFLVTKKQL